MQSRPTSNIRNLLLGCCLLLLSLASSLLPLSAQDGLNLPTDLYVLQTNGQIDRYGIGVIGVSTITPDDTFVVDFAVAPDGNWLAYRTQEALYLDNMFREEDDIQLEGTSASVPPIRGQGETITWSPDGSAVAYTTLTGLRVYFTTGQFFDIEISPLLHLTWSPNGTYLAGEAEGNIWWIYRRAGTELILTSAIPFSYGIDWLNDSQLVLMPDTGGMFIMDLASGNAQTPLLDASAIYHRPFVEPAGTILAFAETLNDSSRGQLVRVSSGDTGATANLIATGDIMLENILWTPGGRLVVAFQGGALALIDPTSGGGFTLPITSAATYGWGVYRPNTIDSLILSQDGYFLAEDGQGIVQVWQLPRDNRIPFTVTPAEASIKAYAISANGDQVAYVSDNQLFLHTIGTEDDAQALVAIETTFRNVRFSPDGGRLIYVTDSTPDNPEGGVWQLDIASSETQLILQNGPAGEEAVYAPPFYRNPQFAPNINAILVEAGGGESTILQLVDLNTGEVLDVGQYDAGFWLRDGRLVVYGTGIGIGDPQESNITILDINTQAEPIPLFTIPPTVRVESLEETQQGNLRLITQPNIDGPTPQRVVNIPINGDASRLQDIGFIQSPRFSNDARYIAGLTHPQGSLMVMDTQSQINFIIAFPASVWSFQWR